MKIFKRVVSTVLFLSLIACNHVPPMRDFDKTKKVQTIQLSNKQYIYAQNDVLLNSTLEKELAKMSPDWDKEIKKYNSYSTIAGVGVSLQLLTLIGCLVASDTGAALAWCGASLGSAFLISFPYINKASAQKYKFVNDFNSSF